MAKKGCGLLLFVSVVVFCAGAAHITVAAFSMMLAWMTMGKISSITAPDLLFNILLWGSTFIAGTIGVFWARAMLRSDTK